MSTPVPVNETNKRRIEDAATANGVLEYGWEENIRAEFEDGKLPLAYTETDFELEDGSEINDVGIQTEIIVGKDGIYMWHAYTTDTITCEYFEPLEEEEIEAIATGEYNFDCLYSWMNGVLGDLVDSGEFTYVGEED